MQAIMFVNGTIPARKVAMALKEIEEQIKTEVLKKTLDKIKVVPSVRPII